MLARVGRDRARAADLDVFVSVFASVRMIVCVFVLVHDLDDRVPAAQCAQEPRHGGEQQHPPTTHAELAAVTREGVEDVQAQQQQSRADDTLHHRVDT